MKNETSSQIDPFIQSILKWEEEIKEKDALLSKKSKLERKLPPIRNRDNPIVQEAPKIETIAPTKTKTNENKFQELKKNINNDHSQSIALKLKDKGNKLYSEGKYLEAIEYYSKAINIDSSNSTFWGNRAICYFHLQDSLKCERDCNMAISLDPNNIKFYLRRGHARKILQKFEQSLEDFNHVLKHEKKNKDALQQIEILTTLMKPQPKITPIEVKSSPNKSINTPTQNKTETNNKGINQPSIPPKQAPLIIETNQQIPKKTENLIQEIPEKKETPPPKVISTPTTSNITTNTVSTTNTITTYVNNNSNSKEIKPQLNLQAPSSFFEFTQTFSSLKKDESSLFSYFQLIDPAKLPALFKSSFTEEHLLSFISIFLKFYVKDNLFERIYQFLFNFLKIDRFDMIIMFLSEKNKKDLFSLFDLLQNNCDSNLLNSLKQKYLTL